MKRMLLFAILFAALLVPIVTMADVTVPQPYVWQIRPIQHGFDGQHVELAFTLKPGPSWRSPITEASVRVKADSGIIYNGLNTWMAHFKTKFDSSFTVLNLIIPPNDTSEIEFIVVSDGFDREFLMPYYFITFGDSIEYWNGPPQRTFTVPKPKRLNRDTLKQSDLDAICDVAMTLTTAEQKATAEEILGISPKIDPVGRARVKTTFGKLLELHDAGINCELLHQRDTTSVPRAGADSQMVPVLLPPIKISRNDAEKERMRRREQTPLLDKNVEAYYIDGEMWQRSYGETKFHKVQPITDVDAYLKQMNDSIQTLPPDHRFDICLMLTNDKEMSQARTIVGNLPEPVDSIYYKE